MKNALNPGSQVLPFLDPKNRANARISAQGAREAILNRVGLKSVLNLVAPYLPNDPHNPLQHPTTPLTWAQLLKIPTSIPSRIFWAALSFDALRADAVEHHIALRNSIEQRLEEAAAKASQSHEHKEERINDDELTAGELDENYNSPAAIEDLEKSEEDFKRAGMMAQAAAKIAAIFASSYRELQEALGIPYDNDVMTDEEVNAWVEKNEGPEYDLLKNHFLNNLADHAEHFGLEQVALADRFANRLTAMVMKGGKTLGDVEKLAPDMAGRAFDYYHEKMRDLANQMMQYATRALQNAGANPTTSTAPTPVPQPTFKQKVEEALLGMNAPSLAKTQENMDPAHRFAQLRLAAVQAMHPTQHTSDELKMKFPEPSDAPSPKQTPTKEQLHEQLAVHAKKLGVSVQALGQAADRTLLQQLWPNDPATRQAMKDSPVVTPEKRQSLMAKAMKDSMRPQQGKPQQG